MSIVGVRELKSHLTQYLRKTKAGEEVIITERGMPIAVIHPAKKALPSKSSASKLAELAKEGKISLPQQKFLLKIPIIKISGSPISETVLEERR